MRKSSVYDAGEADDIYSAVLHSKLSLMRVTSLRLTTWPSTPTCSDVLPW